MPAYSQAVALVGYCVRRSVLGRVLTQLLCDVIMVVLLQLTEGIARVMAECWSPSPHGRLTSLRVCKTLKKLLETTTDDDADVKV